MGWLSALIHVLHVINHEVSQLGLVLVSNVLSVLIHLHYNTASVAPGLGVVPHKALDLISGRSLHLRWDHLVCAAIL